ncbi:DMT family transporter [Alphaproteobacteria bacterium]|nr:DMT family transporter [Alphaproteobacteria bacterium]
MNAVKARTLGVSTALAAVTIWSVFLVNTRFAISSNFSVEEVMTLRLVTASIVTLPFMIKLGVILRGQSFVSTVMIALMPSAVAPYIISSGLFYASASDSGALAPGTLPFWAALFSFLLIGEKPSKLRLVGLLAIFIGAISVGLTQMLDGSNSETWKGHLLFLLGACLWAIYTIYFKQAGLRPVQGLVVGLFWGTLFLVPVLFMTGEVSFSNVSIQEIVWVCLLQGVLIGVLAMILYSIAIRCLGAAQTAAFGALTPILALFGGVVFLNEMITTGGVMGIFLVAVGVILASGSFEKNT